MRQSSAIRLYFNESSRQIFQRPCNMRALPKASGVSQIRAEGVQTPLGRVSCGPGRRVQARVPGMGDIDAS